MAEQDRILTDEESEALLSESADAAGSGRDGAAGIRELQSSFFEHVAPERVPELEAIAEDLAEVLEQIWGAMFRQSIVVSAEAAKIVDWRGYAARVPSPDCVNVVEIKGQAQRCLIVFASGTVSSMVDQFFGGAGTVPRSERLTALTEMEKRLMQRFTGALLDSMARVWARFGGFEFSLLDVEFDDDVLSQPEPPKRIFLCPFRFEIGEHQHVIELVWPAAIVEKLRAPRRAQGAPALPRPEHDWSARLQEDIKDARVVLRAVLGETTIKLGEIAGARPGDIIATNPLTLVKLYAGGKPVLEGTLGTHRGLNAVKINGPTNRKLLENGNG